MESSAANNSYSAVNAIERAVAVLEDLAGRRDGRSVTELAESMGLNKSIVFRVLASLQQKGYVVQDPATQRYRLTLKLVTLAHRHTEGLGLRGIYQPMLSRLAERVNELVQLCVVEGDGMINLARSDSSQPVRVATRLGHPVALHATAAGKVWLASLPEERVVRILGQKGLPAVTPHTITSIDRLLRELEQVRQVGYAVVEQEAAEGVNTVATPITPEHWGGQVVGAIAVVGPASRLDRASLIRLAPFATAAASELAAAWPPPGSEAAPTEMITATPG